MFPITADYIEGQYLKKGQLVGISDPKLIEDLEKTARKVIRLIRRGLKFTPTQPNSIRIEQLMLEELSKNIKNKI